MIISYNSKHVIISAKRDDHESIVKIYCLDTYELIFEESFGGRQEDFIKLKEIEQNSDGTKFAIAYFNDGLFRVRVFGT